MFGVPDDTYGEAVAAWVVTRGDAVVDSAVIRDFCKGRIATFKIPVHVKVVDSFPMTVTGKIQKFVMRQQMIDELGLTAARTA